MRTPVWAVTVAALALILTPACDSGGEGELSVEVDGVEVDGADESAASTTEGTLEGNESETGETDPDDDSNTTPGDTPTDPVDPGTDPVDPGTDPVDPGTDPEGEPNTDPTTPNPEPEILDGCSFSGFAPADTQVAIPQSGVLQWAGLSATSDPYDVLLIELYQGSPYNGAIAAGTYSLAGSNYADCGNCVRMRTGCSQASGGCTTDWYADEGELVITDIGDGLFAGEFKNVVLKEVTIDPNTYASTPVPNGKTWCISSLPFSDETASGTGSNPPTSAGNFPVYEGSVSDTCVAQGNGNLINANVADFTLMNCNGEPVSLHQSCGKDAVWFVQVAGW